MTAGEPPQSTAAARVVGSGRRDACPEQVRLGAAMTGTHAIVIGAGITGLFAASAVYEGHDQVTVIDRGALPPDGDSRGAMEAEREPG